MLIGKVYLLDFRLSKCKFCQDNITSLYDIYEKYKNKNFEIISISIDKFPQEADSVAKENQQLPWIHCLTHESDAINLSKKFEVNHFPKLILIDRVGRIIYTNEEKNDSEFKIILEEALRDQEVKNECM